MNFKRIHFTETIEVYRSNVVNMVKPYNRFINGLLGPYNYY